MPVGLAKHLKKKNQNQVMFGSKSSEQHLSSVTYYSKGTA